VNPGLDDVVVAETVLSHVETVQKTLCGVVLFHPTKHVPRVDASPRWLRCPVDLLYRSE
jgi:hypothetical protein